ncbi:thiolase C-terminal domain-containing protein [Pelolinea submarina]|uniref:Acetyl-CoA C-acetyltransferase n=1 Tax=Pelolinea submarina TaxID=913107 RepID=A0A347ZNS8_9CHLR|nr:thiolase domain-containing protein [Pelolinea submarina]REG08562.1 acetyl-CoA C-acetyltransferase [Pelolinea submarina]BBB46959.1 acetyl-CoA C-acetyltransferase [Pelolinea submarina]
MSEVIIAGIGATPVGEHWDLSLDNLGAKAMLAAMRDAGVMRPQALYVGNLLASSISKQANLGTRLADNIGLTGIETFTAEAGEASGAAALRMGYLAVKSGLVESALVLGIEKYTDMVGPEVDAILAHSADSDFESTEGLTPNGLAGLLMQRYMDQYNAPRDAFAALPLLAHTNAVHNPLAMYRKAVDLAAYQRAPLVTPPLNLFDVAPYADGAASLLLVSDSVLFRSRQKRPVRLAASSAAIDALALHDRPDPLAFEAAALSLRKALQNAGLGWENMDLFELWDATSIYGLLALEAGGFAARGQGWRWLQESDLSLKSELPMLTMGGNKARGFPISAAGVYQAVEAVQQLRGQAGENQVPDARTAIIQALGGPASTAITHILTTL